jgi:hypothetical protein
VWRRTQLEPRWPRLPPRRNEVSGWFCVCLGIPSGSLKYLVLFTLLLLLREQLNCVGNVCPVDLELLFSLKNQGAIKTHFCYFYIEHRVWAMVMSFVATLVAVFACLPILLLLNSWWFARPYLTCLAVFKFLLH